MGTHNVGRFVMITIVYFKEKNVLRIATIDELLSHKDSVRMLKVSGYKPDSNRVMLEYKNV